jgi:hypothetical protein
MKYSKSILFLSLVFVLISCKKTHQINNLKWLEGSWLQLENDGSFVETWKLTQTDSGTVLVGKGIWLKDSIEFTEHIHLYESQDEQHFHYRVMESSDDNHSGTIFTSTEINDSLLVFENPTHDFPKKIIYQKMNDSLIHARVLNEEQEIKFVLKKQ